MIYNKYVREWEIEYNKVFIPCLYDIDNRCIHKCQSYWKWFTEMYNNKDISDASKQQQINDYTINYPDICYRIDSYYCDKRFCHYWRCTHHYFPEEGQPIKWDRSIKLTSSN